MTTPPSQLLHAWSSTIPPSSGSPPSHPIAYARHSIASAVHNTHNPPTSPPPGWPTVVADALKGKTSLVPSLLTLRAPRPLPHQTGDLPLQLAALGIRPEGRVVPQRDYGLADGVLPTLPFLKELDNTSGKTTARKKPSPLRQVRQTSAAVSQLITLGRQTSGPTLSRRRRGKFPIVPIRTPPQAPSTPPVPATAAEEPSAVESIVPLAAELPEDKLRAQQIKESKKRDISGVLKNMKDMEAAQLQKTNTIHIPLDEEKEPSELPKVTDTYFARLTRKAQVLEKKRLQAANVEEKQNAKAVRKAEKARLLVKRKRKAAAKKRGEVYVSDSDEDNSQTPDDEHPPPEPKVVDVSSESNPGPLSACTGAADERPEANNYNSDKRQRLDPPPPNYPRTYHPSSNGHAPAEIHRYPAPPPNYDDGRGPAPPPWPYHLPVQDPHYLPPNPHPPYNYNGPHHYHHPHPQQQPLPGPYPHNSPYPMHHSPYHYHSRPHPQPHSIPSVPSRGRLPMDEFERKRKELYDGIANTSRDFRRQDALEVDSFLDNQVDMFLPGQFHKDYLLQKDEACLVVLRIQKSDQTWSMIRIKPPTDG